MQDFSGSRQGQGGTQSAPPESQPATALSSDITQPKLPTPPTYKLRPREGKKPGSRSHRGLEAGRR